MRLSALLLPAAVAAEWTLPGVARLDDGSIDLSNIGGVVANLSRVPPLGVVGGTDVRSAADYPWMTGWLEGSQQYCGGSLISDEWVLSAAHCYFNVVPSSSIGSVRFTSGGGAEIVRGAQWYRHPSYNANSLDYGAGLIRLAGAR